jgi:hypothetical protein
MRTLALVALFLSVLALGAAGQTGGDVTWQSREPGLLHVAVHGCPIETAESARAAVRVTNEALARERIALRFVYVDTNSSIRGEQMLEERTEPERLRANVAALDADAAVVCVREEALRNHTHGDESFGVRASTPGGNRTASLFVIATRPVAAVSGCPEPLPLAGVPRQGVVTHGLLHMAGLNNHASDDRDVFAARLRFEARPCNLIDRLENIDIQNETFERLDALWPATGPAKANIRAFDAEHGLLRDPKPSSVLPFVTLPLWAEVLVLIGALLALGATVWLLVLALRRR